MFRSHAEAQIRVLWPCCQCAEGLFGVNLGSLPQRKPIALFVGLAIKCCMLYFAKYTKNANEFYKM